MTLVSAKAFATLPVCFLEQISSSFCCCLFISLTVSVLCLETQPGNSCNRKYHQRDHVQKEIY